MTDNPLIYKSSEGKAKCMAVYDAALAHWPVPYEQLDLPTRFGSTHVIASGPKGMRRRSCSCMEIGRLP